MVTPHGQRYPSAPMVPRSPRYDAYMGGALAVVLVCGAATVLGLLIVFVGAARLGLLAVRVLPDP